MRNNHHQDQVGRKPKSLLMLIYFLRLHGGELEMLQIVYSIGFFTVQITRITVMESRKCRVNRRHRSFSTLG